METELRNTRVKPEAGQPTAVSENQSQLTADNILGSASNIAKIQSLSAYRSALTKEPSKASKLRLLVRPITHEGKSKYLLSQKGKGQGPKEATKASAGFRKAQMCQPTASSQTQPTAENPQTALDLEFPKPKSVRLPEPMSPRTIRKGKQIGRSNPKIDIFTALDRVVQNSQQNEDERPAIRLEPETIENQEEVNTAYRKKPTFIISKNSCKNWKLPNKTRASASQILIMDTLWSHIRAGTMDPTPVRKVEKEFNNLNNALTSISLTAKEAVRSEWKPVNEVKARRECSVDHLERDTKLKQSSSLISKLLWRLDKMDCNLSAFTARKINGNA